MVPDTFTVLFELWKTRYQDTKQLASTNILFFKLGGWNSNLPSFRSSWPVGNSLCNRIPVKNIESGLCFSYIHFKQRLEKLEARCTKFPLAVESKRNIRETLWH